MNEHCSNRGIVVFAGAMSQPFTIKRYYDDFSSGIVWFVHFVCHYGKYSLAPYTRRVTHNGFAFRKKRKKNKPEEKKIVRTRKYFAMNARDRIRNATNANETG